MPLKQASRLPIKGLRIASGSHLRILLSLWIYNQQWEGKNDRTVAIIFGTLILWVFRTFYDQINDHGLHLSQSPLLRSSLALSWVFWVVTGVFGGNWRWQSVLKVCSCLRKERSVQMVQLLIFVYEGSGKCPEGELSCLAYVWLGSVQKRLGWVLKVYCWFLGLERVRQNSLEVSNHFLVLSHAGQDRSWWFTTCLAPPRVEVPKLVPSAEEIPLLVLLGEEVLVLWVYLEYKGK